MNIKRNICGTVGDISKLMIIKTIKVYEEPLEKTNNWMKDN